VGPRIRNTAVNKNCRQEHLSSTVSTSLPCQTSRSGSLIAPESTSSCYIPIPISWMADED
jgi:hypothetical protein